MIRKIHLAVILIIVSIGTSLAQEKTLERANNKYAEYSFSPAIDIYKKVLDKGFVSADLLKKLGNSYYFNADYKEASEIYKRLVTNYESEVTADYYFRYAQTLRSLGDYEMTDKLMVKFTEMTAGDKRANNFNIDRNYREEIVENSGRYTIGPFEFNTVYSEFAPSYYKEGLLFSSDRDTGNLARYRHTWNAKDFLDLYKTNVDSSSMNRVVKLDKAINTRLHESGTAATKDGKTLYFTRNNFVDGKTEKSYINNFVENEFLSRDSYALREYLVDITPDVDMSVKITNSTGKEVEVAVPITVRFFWPSAGV